MNLVSYQTGLMKQFYITFNNQKVSPMATQLTWSRYTELLAIKDENELMYYINITTEKRLSIDTRNKLIFKENVDVKEEGL